MTTETLHGFEAQFDTLESGKTLVSDRAEKFDAHNALFYSPLVYRVQEAPPVLHENPPDDWLVEGLQAFVRDEFASRTDAVTVPQPSEVSREPIDLLDVATVLRDQFERTLVYRGALEDLLEEVTDVGIGAMADFG